jgi:hypothetical protein
MSVTHLHAITAQGIGMRDAHVAASIGAGSAMPFPWLVCRGGPLNVIGRRTRARSVGQITAIGSRGSAIGLTSRATVGSTGISSRGWRTIGWSPRSVPLAHMTRVDVRVDIRLRICLHDPAGGSQNATAIKARFIVTSL